jgi:ABC-type glycerol-3-phosphate transport system substrate-binding protein
MTGMKRIIALGTIVAALAACTTDNMAEMTAEAKSDAARAVVVPIVMNTELPGGHTIPESIATAMTTCIIENSTDVELTALAAAAVTGPTADTNYMVSNILSRSSTTACASRALTGGAGA